MCFGAFASNSNLQFLVLRDLYWSIALYAASEEDLPHETRILRIADVILSDITMQPVAEEQETVIQRQNDVGHQAWFRLTSYSLYTFKQHNIQCEIWRINESDRSLVAPVRAGSLLTARSMREVGVIARVDLGIEYASSRGSVFLKVGFKFLHKYRI